MTATHDVDRLLATWFAADAVETAPAGLVEAIATATATTRRRPGWLSLDRWLPALPQASAGRSRARAGRAAARGGGRLAHRGGLPTPRATAVRPGQARAVRDEHRRRHRDDELRTAGRSMALTSGDARDSNPDVLTRRDAARVLVVAIGLEPVRARGHGCRRIGTVTRSPRPRSMDRGYDDGTAFAWSPDGRFDRVLRVRRQPVADLRREHRRQAVGPGRRPGDQSRASSMVAGRVDDRVRRRCLRPRPRAVPHASGRHGHPTDHGHPGYASDFVRDVVAGRPPPRVHNARRLRGEGKGANLWMVDVDASNEHLVDEGAFWAPPTWSPDGQRLAWLHAVADLSRPAELDVADADGTNIKRFADDAAAAVRAAV